MRAAARALRFLHDHLRSGGRLATVELRSVLNDLGVQVDGLFFPADYDPPLPQEYQFNLDTSAGRQAFERMLAFIESANAWRNAAAR